MTAATRQIDDTVFGVVYGSITVMALLMGMHPPIEDRGQQALILFGSVFALAIALLAWFGGRIGWRIRATFFSAFIGGVITAVWGCLLPL